MIEKAIEKINTEMQKDPNNKYLEIIGHYIIDRCTDDITAARIAAEGKTLKGAMDAVMAKATAARNGNVAVLTHTTVFAAVDSYFKITTDEQAQLDAMMSAGSGTPVKTPTQHTGNAKRLALDLDAFL
jgi:hypothetical protein